MRSLWTFSLVCNMGEKAMWSWASYSSKKIQCLLGTNLNKNSPHRLLVSVFAKWVIFQVLQNWENQLRWSTRVRASHHQQPCPDCPCPRPLFTCPCYPPSPSSFSLLLITPQSWITLRLEPVWRDSICDSYTDHQSLLIHVMSIFWICGPESSLGIQQEVVCPSKVSQPSRKAASRVWFPQKSKNVQ